MDSDILAGVPFCQSNNIEFSFAKQEIYIHGKSIKYGARPPCNINYISTILRNTSAEVPLSGDTALIETHPPFDQHCKGFATTIPLESCTPIANEVTNGTVVQILDHTEYMSSDSLDKFSPTSPNISPSRDLAAGILCLKKQNILV